MEERYIGAVIPYGLRAIDEGYELANVRTIDSGTKSNSFNAFLGWGISTLLLWLFNRNNGGDTNSNQDATKFQYSTGNNIGSAVPVVLGRAMIKNPLIDYYDDFDYRAYTEEYGMHTGNWWLSLIPTIVLGIIEVVETPDEVVVPSGTGYTTESGMKRAAILRVIITVLLQLLTMLFANHLGRTTIQKGFKYYLGWQSIICWTGDNIGIKRIWMNVYDSELEDSTQTGVWGSNNISWKADNPKGIVAHIDNENMFGGVDENGGFVGDVRIYFGTEAQGHDSWMVDMMSKSENIPVELRGLTPVYPMYMTSVVPKAYIGKQSTIPEMWYEVVNYPNKLKADHRDGLIDAFKSRLDTCYSKVLEYVNNLSAPVKDWLSQQQKNKNSDCILNDLDLLQKELDAGLEATRDLSNFTTMSNTSEDGVWTKLSKANVGVLRKYASSVKDNQSDIHVDSYISTILTNAQDELSTKNIINTEPITSQAYIGAITKWNQLQLDGVAYSNNMYKAFSDAYLQKDEFTSTPTLGTLYLKIKEEFDNIFSYYPQSSQDSSLAAFKDGISDYYSLISNGCWHLGRIGDDLNPAEAIYEILTNELWGCAYNGSRIDYGSLILLGGICENEGLGVSCLITETATAGSYIKKILDHVNGIVFDDPKTGNLKFKLIRNDYVTSQLEVFNESNCESLEFTRLDWSETVCAVSNSFTNASDKFNTSTLSIQDIANYKITKNYAENTVSSDYFTTVTNAKTYAQNQLLSMAYPLATVNIKTNRFAYNLSNGTPICVSWKPYGIDTQVFRVSDIDYGSLEDGTITITALEDVFGFSNSEYSYVNNPSWIEVEHPPADIVRYLFLELPYEITRSLNTYIHGYAARPSADTIKWFVYRNTDNKYLKVASSNTFSIIGKLVYGAVESFDVDNIGFEFSPIGTGTDELLEAKSDVIDNNRLQYNSSSGTNLAIIDDEIISYENVRRLSNGNFQVYGVARGVCDTVPSSHTSESLIVFLDTGINVADNNMLGYVCASGATSAEQFGITSASAGSEQSFDYASLIGITTKRRSEAPNIMNNLQFGADRGTKISYDYNIVANKMFSGDILFKFYSRNKFYQFTIYSQTDTDDAILVEPSTVNVITVLNNGVEFDFKESALTRDSTTGLNINKDNMTLTWEYFCEQMGNKISRFNYTSLKIRTYDTVKKLYSHATFERTINYVAPVVVGCITPTTVFNLANMQQYYQECDTLAQQYADTIVDSSYVHLLDNQVFNYENCCLIMIGRIATSGESLGMANIVIGQNSSLYNIEQLQYIDSAGVNQLAPVYAYRIDGIDAGNKAIMHKITINEHYTIADTMSLTSGTSLHGYKFRTGSWRPYTFY